MDENKDFLLTPEGISSMSAKMKNQRKMAYIALGSIIGVTLILLTPFVPESRILALSDPLGWFYISMASLVGTYMGIVGWMNRK